MEQRIYNKLIIICILFSFIKTLFTLVNKSKLSIHYKLLEVRKIMTKTILHERHSIANFIYKIIFMKI